MAQKPEKVDSEKLALFTQIAKTHFFMETLETRHSDSLDFKEVAVWSVKNALQAAFQAGYDAAVKQVSPNLGGSSGATLRGRGR
jgi:hypothetical protein